MPSSTAVSRLLIRCVGALILVTSCSSTSGDETAADARPALRSDETVADALPALGADPTSCDFARAVVASSADEIASGELRMLNFEAVTLASPSTIDFGKPTLDDPSWTLYFRGLSWLMPLVLSDSTSHHQLALDYVDAWTASWPDGGLATDPGWDEGTNLRRLESLACIADRIGSEGVDLALTQSLAAAMDPARYPNVPRPNNHAAIVNRAILRTGEILGRDDLIEFALSRMQNDWRQVWSAAGFDFEQSSSYLGTNISLWIRISGQFEKYGLTAEAAALTERLESAMHNNALLLEPDGGIAAVGDSTPAPPPPGTVKIGGPVTVIDRETGWALGRTSWADDATHWTIRFGPAKIEHGHYDAGSLTWSVDGVRALVDPGFHTYATSTDPFAAWDHNLSAHNVAQPGVTAEFLPKAGSLLIADSDTDDWNRFDIATYQFSMPQRRTILVFRRTPLLLVVDDLATKNVQSWHLDPRWEFVEAGDRSLSWADGDGRRLTARTTAEVFPRVRGVDDGGVAGWVFPAFGTKVAADQATAVDEGRIATIWYLDGAADRGADVSFGNDGAVVLTIDGETLVVPAAPPTPAG